MLTYFPEWKEEIQGVENKLETFKGNYNTIYSMYKDIESQKDFALKVTSNVTIPGILFSMRNCKTFDEAVRDVNIKSLVKVLELE